MAFVVQNLASGSSGNATLVRADETILLIDAGIAASAILQRLGAWNLEPTQLTAVLLTHEHSDHVMSVGTLSRQLGVPVIATAATLDAAEVQVGALHRQALPIDAALDFADASVSPFAIPHDAAAPVGFVIRHRDGTLVYATDLGHPDPALLPYLAEADLLILEANHDPDRLARSRYTASLKARIRGPRGHLSNVQAAQLITGLGNERPRTVWLGHLSAQNNTPKLARSAVEQQLDVGGISGVRIEVLQRNRPGPIWSPDSAGCQLSLFDSVRLA